MCREEFTVELQYIKPCILKRVQRGVARAEVVHQQNKAMLLYLFGHTQCCVIFYAFGYFKLKQMLWQTIFINKSVKDIKE